jgi:DNA-binding NarL/FixJ family response regulator
MPKTSAPMGGPATASHLLDTGATVTLIAQEGPRERIGAVLEEQGWDFAAFESVQALLEHSTENENPESENPLVALWVEDASSSAAQRVELLRGGIEDARAVVICSEIQRWDVRAVLAAGAAGVVLEGEMAGTLGPCLQAVRVGQICVPRQQWRQIAPPALSAREKQILALVVMGYMNGQIAEQLFLAESTVKSHLSSAFGKLGVRSRNEAVNLILDSERGLGMGILALGGEPLETAGTG